MSFVPEPSVTKIPTSIGNILITLNDDGTNLVSKINFELLDQDGNIMKTIRLPLDPSVPPAPPKLPANIQTSLHNFQNWVRAEVESKVL